MIDFLTLIIALISLIISIVTYALEKKGFTEEYQARVVAFFEIRDNKIYLIIKNVGKSIASNINVEFYPKLSTILHPDFKRILPLISDYTDYTLAPNQELAEAYDITKSKDRIFTVTISFKSNINKQLSYKYTLNTYYFDNIIDINNV